MGGYAGGWCDGGGSRRQEEMETDDLLLGPLAQREQLKENAETEFAERNKSPIQNIEDK